MNIIGLSGTNGSGKDTVGHFLADKFGYVFISLTDMLRAECRVRGVPVDRQHLREISAEWRREHGLGVMIDKSIQHYQSLEQAGAGLVVASLRNPGEVDRIHELHGQVIWVDADPTVRFARIQSAGRNRGAEDDKTYEEFLAEEAAEMTSNGDAATLNMSAVRDLADIQITNQTDRLHLEDAVTQAIGLG